MNLLSRSGDSVHLYLLPFKVIAGVIAYFPWVKVAPQQPVDILEDVEDKIGSHPLRIIVGLF